MPNSRTDFKFFSNCRFYVQIDGVTAAVFTEVSGLQLETEVFEYSEGGKNDFPHRLPGRSKAGNVTLKRGIAQGSELFKWCFDTVQGKVDLRGVSVLMFDTIGDKPIARWELLKAFPTKWAGPQFQADGHLTAIETLELAHQGYGPNSG